MGGWRIVEVPETVSQAIGIRGNVPVVGTVARARGHRKAAFRGTLMPRGGGRHLVVVNASLRSETGLEAGDRAAFVFQVDPEPRARPTPEDLADALHEHGMHEAFETLAPGMRRQWIQWVEGAVHETTRMKRIVRVVELVLRKHEARVDRELAKEAARRRGG